VQTGSYNPSLVSQLCQAPKPLGHLPAWAMPLLHAIACSLAALTCLAVADSAMSHPGFGAIPFSLQASFSTVFATHASEVLECGTQRSSFSTAQVSVSSAAWRMVWRAFRRELGLLGFHEHSFVQCSPIEQPQVPVEFAVLAMMDEDVSEPQWGVLQALLEHTRGGVFAIPRTAAAPAVSIGNHSAPAGACVCDDVRRGRSFQERLGGCQSASARVDEMSVREWAQGWLPSAREALRGTGCESYVCRVGRSHRSVVPFGSDAGLVGSADPKLLEWLVRAQASHPDNALTGMEYLRDGESRLDVVSAVGCLIAREAPSRSNEEVLRTCTSAGERFTCDTLPPMVVFDDGSVPPLAHRFVPPGVFGRTPKGLAGSERKRMVPLGPSLSMGCKTSWTLFVDQTVEHYLRPLIHALAEGLGDAGLNVTVVTCGGQDCPSLFDPEWRDASTQLVLFGLNQVSWTLLDTVQRFLLFDWMRRVPEDAIVFNFDFLCRASHTPQHLKNAMRRVTLVDGGASAPWVSEQYLAVLRGFEVWDYSLKNSECLGREHGIRSEYVPLSGFAQAWIDEWDCQEGEPLMNKKHVVDAADLPLPLIPENCTAADRQWALSHGSWLPEGETESHEIGSGTWSVGRADEDIDVLFIGSVIPTVGPQANQVSYRLNSLQRLQSLSGLHVVRVSHVHGAALARFVRRARIVINLSNFGMECETKWSRITQLLMVRRFVLSELSGSNCPDDVWMERAGGVGLFTDETMIAAVLHFLAHPEERGRIAEAGYAALRERPVRSLVRGSVIAWHNRRGCALPRI
jgi:hypothetical protein